MENKYYTPEYSDIYIGQELYTIDEYKIDLSTVDSLTWFLQCQNCYIDCEENTTYGISLENYKLKYLDSSDIEELGFTYKGKTIDVWFEKEGNFDMGTWTSYKCQLHYGLHDNRLFIDMIDMSDEIRVFNGIVKNKSELKKVLNMLNIK